MRFDYYFTKSKDTKGNEISDIMFKDAIDNLPELDVDFRNIEIQTIKESKTHKKHEFYFYPGFALKVRLVRDPFPKILRYFMPSIILGLFLYLTFNSEDYTDRLANLSICLLSYIEILTCMREELPEISRLTVGDMFVLTYIMTSILPIFDTVV